jgi:site-specific recombinase XerD
MRLRHTKNGEDRYVKMNAGLVSLLRSIPPTSESIFLNEKGSLLSRYKIDDTIASLQKQHPNMKKWRCHDLRHSFAYNFLKSKGDMYALKAILGHKSIQLTIDLYGHFKACDVERPSPYES